MTDEIGSPITHVLKDGNETTYCGGGIFGDRAITLAQALESDNDMYFDCHACYLEITAEKE